MVTQIFKKTSKDIEGNAAINSGIILHKKLLSKEFNLLKVPSMQCAFIQILSQIYTDFIQI